MSLFDIISRNYHSASSKNLIDELFKNHNNNGYVNKDEYNENNYIIYVYEFKKYNIVYVGLTNDIDRRDKQHLWSKDDKMSLFCKELNIPLTEYKILEKELKSSEAQKREKFWVNFYIDNGWNMFNIAKPGALGGNTIKWNKKNVKKIANKYKNRREFQKNEMLAYSAAIRLNILDELFKNYSNNGYSKVKNGYWTKENIQEEVKKYKYRTEFSKCCGSAYNISLKLNILNEIFENHPNKGFKVRCKK